MDLLILSSSFSAEFSKLTLGLFKKFGLWSFKVIKQLFVLFTDIRSTSSLFSIIFFPSALTLLLILSRIFLYVNVIVSKVDLLYLSFSIWYIFDVLSTKRQFNVLKTCLLQIFASGVDVNESFPFHALYHLLDFVYQLQFIVHGIGMFFYK